MRPLNPLLLIMVLSILACSGSDDGTDAYSFQIYEENGITIAETANGPKYSSPLFTCEVVARIDEDESIEESLLTRPRWMGFDEQGSIYLFDGVATFHETRLVVFDESGRFSHLIGRMGDGPGEYRDPDLLTIADDIITLYDRALRRVSWFHTDGQFLRMHTFDPQESIPDQVSIDADGNQIMVRRGRGEGLNSTSQTATIRASDGVVIGTIETPRVKAHFGLEKPSRWMVATPPRFSGQAQLLFSPDRGILQSTGQEPVIEWFDLSGTKCAEYRLGLEPGPVTEEDQALADQYFRDLYLNGNPLGEEIWEAWQQADQYPKIRAFWSHVAIDEYDYLWLEDPSSYFLPTERHFRVIAPNGEYLGDCSLPKGMVRFSYGHYLVIDMDREKQDVIVYRLIPAVDGLVYPR